MINLTYIPQRADFKARYEIDSDKLIVTIGEVVEIFDFTGLKEGAAEEIIVENLPVNPVVKAEKAGEEIDVIVIRFYTFDEKEEFENGYN